MTRYSPEFKEQVVRKMMPPSNQSVASIHRESGISAPSPTCQRTTRQLPSAFIYKKWADLLEPLNDSRFAH